MNLFTENLDSLDRNADTRHAIRTILRGPSTSNVRPITERQRHCEMDELRRWVGADEASERLSGR